MSVNSHLEPFLCKELKRKISPLTEQTSGELQQEKIKTEHDLSAS